MAEERTPFYVHCAKCSHQWVVAYMPMPAEMFGKFKNARCPMCAAPKPLCGEHPKATNEGDPIAWLTNGDTGTSSKTIWAVMTGRTVGDKYFHPDVPYDPSDFGRCHRLLEVMPSWRARLPEVAAKYPKWAGLVDAWDELTADYLAELPSGKCQRLYKRLQELREGRMVAR